MFAVKFLVQKTPLKNSLKSILWSRNSQFRFFSDQISSKEVLSQLAKLDIHRFPELCEADEAVKVIQSGHRVFIHTASAAPQKLIHSMTARSGELRNVEVCHMHTEGDAAYVNHPESFRVNSLFVGKNVRKQVTEGKADFIPIFLSDIHKLFKKKLPIDVALITVSPPDRHGFCSMGTSVCVSLEAAQSAKIVIAQVNKFMPRTHGMSLIHVKEIDKLVAHDEPLPETLAPVLTPETQAIGNIIASMIENGSCLQMGIGGIPDATLSFLKSHQDLGIHTEMFSEGLLSLVDAGVITNSRKKFYQGQIVSSFLVGSRKLYDFVDDNPIVKMLPASLTNDPAIIRSNPKVVAINSAIEVDITGQVCSDSIGMGIYSGIGGQVDFERGAFLSEGGKAIIALTSRTHKNLPRIVPMLKSGAGVVTSRGHVNYVVTEYGAVNLFGENLRNRAKPLISIAHPDDRQGLYEFYEKNFGKLE